MQGQTASYVITMLVTKPNSNTLSTLTNTKTELGIASGDTTNDAWLTTALNQVSSAIARYCNRVFGAATWQDEFRPASGVWGDGVRARSNPLMLTKWPLSSAVVSFTGNTYGTNLVDGIADTSKLAQGNLVGGPGIVAGTTIAAPPGANSITLSQATTTTATAVALNTGISVAETIAGTTNGLTAGIDYEVDAGSLLPGDEGPARLWRLNEQGNPRTWAAAKIVVVYPAGYSLPNDASPNMPSDLEDACLRLVTQRFKAKGRDPMLRSQGEPGLGQQQFWVGTLPGQNGVMPPEIEALVNPYRVPVTAAT